MDRHMHPNEKSKPRPTALHRAAMALAAALALVAGSALADVAPPGDRLPRPVDGKSARYLCSQFVGGTYTARTDLFFGLNRPGGVVQEHEFQAFLDEEVTPRFPAGLTVIDAKGQFRGAPGHAIDKEAAKQLILIYPFSAAASARVETIRRAYKARFQQQSVLRLDEFTCVSF